MKKTIAILAALVMALTAVAGCSADKENENGGGSGSTTPTDAPNNGGDENNGDNGGDENNGGSEGEASDFASWTDVDMVNYLKAEGIFTDDSLLYTQTGGDEAPIGVSKCISYMDDYLDAYILIFWFDPNSPVERTEEIYNEIKTTQTYIMTEAGDFPQPFNTLIGRFAFFYSFCLDTDLVDKTTAALEKLESDFGVEPDFVNMDIDESDYEEYENIDDYDDYDE